MGQEMTLPQMLKTSSVSGRFQQILGNEKKAAKFVSSLLTLYNENEKFRKCDPSSILVAAGTAAQFDLPIMPQLGYAYVIPYYDYKSGKNVAQFQIGYKGMIQLAMRSGQFRTLNTTEIYKGQIKRINYITGEIEVGERTTNEVVGYIAYMELINGFSKTLYMSKEDVKRHAQNFSESYKNEKTRERSVWTKNFDAMAEKTVMKKLLNAYAPTSIEMQDGALARALRADQESVIKMKENISYNEPLEENQEFDTIDIVTGEILNEKDEVEKVG